MDKLEKFEQWWDVWISEIDSGINADALRWVKEGAKAAWEARHPEIHALKHDIEHLMKSLNSAEDAVENLERENAELRARITRLESCISAPPRGFCEGLGELSTRLDWLAKAHDIREESPAQSLAAIKAEALRELDAHIVGDELGCQISDWIKDEIERIKQEFES